MAKRSKKNISPLQQHHIDKVVEDVSRIAILTQVTDVDRDGMVEMVFILDRYPHFIWYDNFRTQIRELGMAGEPPIVVGAKIRWRVTEDQSKMMITQEKLNAYIEYVNVQTSIASVVDLRHPR